MSDGFSLGLSYGCSEESNLLYGDYFSEFSLSLAEDSR